MRGEHINMPERLARGVWPHPPLNLSEVLTHLTKLISHHRLFPHEWQPQSEGEPVREGGVIERQGIDRYVYRAVRAHPVRPDVVAECTERVFSSAEDAARYFLKLDLHLPGDLDGWKVIE